MKINLAPPLRFFKWSLFIFAIFLVELLGILPISILLFNEFYKDLIPSDSSQWVPLSAFNLQRISDHAIFTQRLHYVPMGTELTRLRRNGLPQDIPLREHFKYKIDLDIKFYCLFDESGPNNLNLLDVRVDKKSPDGSGDPTPIFSASFPVVCLLNDDTISLPEKGQLKQSRLESYKTEWLNVIHLEDIEVIDGLFKNKDILMITIMAPDISNYHGNESTREGSKDSSKAIHMKFIFDPSSSVRFRVDFTQDIRNWMMRWKALTYAFGIIIVFSLMTLLFLTGVAVAWHTTSGVLARSTSAASASTTGTSPYPPSSFAEAHLDDPRENKKLE